ncbi:unnamed protein product [Closterium sp. Yama58-4]|nr:unnamed protein product [Closterium sp. Yama58-4]
MEFDHRVEMDLSVPADVAWQLWVDLEQAPKWMKWIQRVDLLPASHLEHSAAAHSSSNDLLSSRTASAAAEAAEGAEGAEGAEAAEAAEGAEGAEAAEAAEAGEVGGDLQHRIQLSRWTCCTTGFEVSWTARVMRLSESPPDRVLTWQTVEGIPCRGQVTIRDAASSAQEGEGPSSSAVTSNVL